MSLNSPNSPYPIPNSMIRESLGFSHWNYKNALPGVELVEEGDIDSSGYDCSSHTFEEEDWFRHTNRMLLFESSALSILADAGYSAVADPDEGDVAIYLTRCWPNEEEYRPRHYGRVVSEGLIESKFGEHNAVFRHQVDHIPQIYGEYVLFCRRLM